MSTQDSDQRTVGERLHLRAHGAEPCPTDAAEVVYADEYDDLCDVANELAISLRPFAGEDCHCEGDMTCRWCYAAQALRRFEDGDR